MSLITLLNSKHLSLLSNKLIYNPEEVGSLKSVEEKAIQLDQTLGDAEKNIASAQNEATEQGYKDGFDKGKAEGIKEAQKEAAENRLAEHHRVKLDDDQLKAASIDLAIDIVRHIGLDRGTPETLRVLAEKVVRSLHLSLIHI